MSAHHAARIPGQLSLAVVWPCFGDAATRPPIPLAAPPASVAPVAPSPVHTPGQQGPALLRFPVQQPPVPLPSLPIAQAPPHRCSWWAMVGRPPSPRRARWEGRCSLPVSLAVVVSGPPRSPVPCACPFSSLHSSSYRRFAPLCMFTGAWFPPRARRPLCAP